MTLTLSSGATATTNTSGAYTLSGLANGTYTITPSKSGYSFTPASKSVTISGANPSTINFTAAQNSVPKTITLDAQVRQDQTASSYTISSPVFSTSSGHELLLALVAAGVRNGNWHNTSVTGVSGGGLTWVFTARTQTQRGTAEIWRAFSPAPLSAVSVTAALSQGVTSSMTILSFAGVDPSGAVGAVGQANGSLGAPAVSLTTTRANSLVVGVGNDPRPPFRGAPGWPNAAAPGPRSVGQHLLGSDAQQSRPRERTGVTINDTAPPFDPFNLSAVEVLVAP